MGGYGDVQMIDENGLRVDGRGPADIRPVSIETGVIPVADGSARVIWGTNHAVAAVYGPMEAHPRKIQRQDRAVLDVRYNMAPFSTTDRMRPGFNRRSREISKVTADALESVVLLEMYPRSKIRIEIEILTAEAGTRCVGLTAASVALAHAGIPMTDMVVSVASGKINDVVVCDLNKEEDNYGEADLPMGILPNTGELVFLQMDGDLSPAEFQEAWDYNMEAALVVHQIMVEALKRGDDSSQSRSFHNYCVLIWLSWLRTIRDTMGVLAGILGKPNFSSVSFRMPKDLQRSGWVTPSYTLASNSKS